MAPAGVPLVDPDAIATALLAAGKRRAAAEAVIRANGSRIRPYLLSVLRDADLADDAYSIWCEWVLNGISGYRGDAPLRTWSYGVAHNAARRIRDDVFRRRRCSLSRAGSIRVAHRSSSSARHLERAARALEAIRARLSLDEQGLLALRIDHGLDWESVAAILSPGPGERPASAAALRKRFERLKDRIRRLARDAGALEG
jgi:RNA polymerase sigma-70 factor (ECF subfamily)